VQNEERVALLGWTDREEWGRAGHVARNWELIKQENILVGGEEEKIPLGRPWQRWHHFNTTPVFEGKKKKVWTGFNWLKIKEPSARKLWMH